MTRNFSVPLFDIAIVGGGFTGAILAARLLRETPDDVSVLLIERGNLLGRGIAYGTQYGWHLLNVPADGMSAVPEQPDHFLRWANTNYDPAVGPDSFVPRRVYGQYVESILRDAVGSNPGRFNSRQDEAMAIERSSGLAKVLLRSGEMIEARKVVFALGNLPPGDPSLPGKPADSSRYFPYAWSTAPLENLEGEREILLVGTGLTAVDTAIALRGRNFTGTIHVLSRRGLLPRQHKPSPPWPPFWNENSPRTARGLLRLIRSQVKAALDLDIGWRSVFDALRPCTAQIWQSLPLSEKRRFLRHARSYWEVHRHRVSPEIAGLIAHQLISQELRTHAGRILSYDEDALGVTITYRERRTQQKKTLRVDRVINCTGPETDCRRLDHPLLASLRQQGLACPDELFLGLQTDTDGALTNAMGVPSDFLYAVGPARKGLLWETTAIPEILDQIAALAKSLRDATAREKTPRLNFEPLGDKFPLQL
jgi:uncharacterized NAD(P)/FAD-binding protein YdhS